MIRRSVGAALVPICLLAACTDVGLEPVDKDQTKTVDDLITISGKVCTSDPDDVEFPVKILLIVDASGSMQFTDPSTSNTTNTVTVSGGVGNLNQNVNAYQSCVQSCSSSTASGGAGLPLAACQNTYCKGSPNPGRVEAVRELVDRFKNNPAVSFAIIRFNGRVTVNGADVTTSSAAGSFTKSESVLNTAIAGLAQADITTDYQGALTSAYELLEQDMRNAGQVERARTKYVVIFFSDGGPNPVCKKGCDNDPSTVPSKDSWCDLSRSEWCDEYWPNNSSSSAMCQDLTNWYPSMKEPCQAYNTDREILLKVKEIVDLGTQYSVGEIRFHTAFLFVPTLPQTIQDLMGVDYTKSAKLLQDMADAGDGVFRSFAGGQQIEFLSFLSTSVSRPYGMTNLILTNRSVLTDATDLLPDSDGDGLDDDTEFDYGKGLKMGSQDSDGDGYNDKLEYDRRNAGFDPTDRTVPLAVCGTADQRDDDGDGLNKCEEAVLGTDPKIADTDRDRIPDGLEFIWGTNPLVVDDKRDADYDGKLSGEEIRIHANPMRVDTAIHSDYAYVYDTKETPEGPDRKRCYTFTVRQVRLITTVEKSNLGSLGYNDIMVYFAEGPADDPLDYGTFWAACVRAQYVEPNVKDPASGQVTLEPSDFLKLEELVRAKALGEADPGCSKKPKDASCQDPCKGIRPP